MLNLTRPRLLMSMALLCWLPSCVPEQPGSPAAALVGAGSDASARRAEIIRQIRRICPAPMTGVELARAADYVEAHPDALFLVSRLDLFDRQARVCRGESS